MKSLQDTILERLKLNKDTKINKIDNKILSNILKGFGFDENCQSDYG